LQRPETAANVTQFAANGVLQGAIFVQRDG
jgi:hypothetical protein